MTTDQALVLAGHGSHHDHRSARPVYAHAERIRRRGRFDAVRPAFWKEQPSLAEVVGTVEAATVYVVPLLTCEGYFAERVFPRELGVRPGESVRHDRVVYTEPVGTHDRIADVVADHVRTVTPDGTADADLVVALVGHGTDRHDGSSDATVDHAERLRETGRFADVTAVFLDQDPNVADLLPRFSGRDVVLVPLFVGEGPHVTRDVPEAVGLPTDGDPFGGPTTVDASRLWYTEPVGTAPGLSTVVLDRAAEAGADTRADTVDTVPSTSEAAFLQWLDAAPAETGSSDRNERCRRWGELAITFEPATDSGSTYSIRHRADRGAPPENLASLETPAAVRRWTGRDAAGNHRPLRTARTLQSGWEFTTSVRTELIRAVRAVYPGSVDHWARERDGTLEPTDVGAVVARQAGRYREVDDLEPERWSRAVEACCGHCVRRPAWGPEADGPEVDEGSFPCPEPCSFLLEAARSLADVRPAGEVGPIDQAVPAAAFDREGNRYRARFLRSMGARASAMEAFDD